MRLSSNLTENKDRHDKELKGPSVMVCETVCVNQDSRVQELEQKVAVLERELRQKQHDAALGALAGGIIHTFKNQLMILGGNLEFLKGLYLEDEQERYTLPDEKVRSMVMACIDATTRIGEKTKSVLDYSRGIKNEQSIVDLYNLIDYLVAPFEIVNKKSVIVKHYRTEPYVGISPLIIKCNPEAISTAFSNALENAIEVAPENSKIGIDVEKHPSNSNLLSIRIKDCGPGIPKDSRHKIFTLGYTSKKKGNGVGLALSKKYLNENGGDMRYATREGLGTSFYIDFSYELLTN